MLVLVGLLGAVGIPFQPTTASPGRAAWLEDNCLNAARTCMDLPRSQINVTTDTLPSGSGQASSTTDPQASSTTHPKASSTTHPEAGAQPATRAPTRTNLSGLAWSSGAVGDNLAGFAAWRGRPLDNTTTWPNRATWNEISHPDIYGAVGSAPVGVTLSLGLAMLPDPANGASFAECAAGAYDHHYRTYGSQLVQLGRAASIVRLGWEANGDWFSWSIGSDVANYKACFRRQVAAIRSTDPRVLIDWNMNKDSHMDVPVAEAYPGNDVVDIVGVDFYDMWPAYPNQAAWNADYMRTQNGGPRGLGAWLAFARAHGKPLSVPEWGTTPARAGSGAGDHAAYIQAMHGFFTEHTADIAYETYFNIHSGFQLWPSTVYPRSAAEYRLRF
jgi:hypothetical protein